MNDFDGLAALITGGASGIGAAGDVSQSPDEEWARVLDIHVTGIARVTRAALPHLRRSRHAAVVNMCSAVAFVGVVARLLSAAQDATATAQALRARQSTAA